MQRLKGVSNEIKQLIKGSFGHEFLRHQNNTCAGFMNVSIPQNFQQLHDTSGNITDLDLQSNEERMKKTWNQEQPIETVFQ